MNLWSFIDNELSVPLFGAPLTVIGMAFGGALASFAYGKPETSRKRLFLTVLANTYLGTIVVVILPAWLSWGWVDPVLAPPLAGAMSFALRFTVPVAIELVPQWIRRVFGSTKSSGEG